MASTKQVAANRRNALRSTGPRSQAGKARSRLNALKHGAYSAHYLTPDEQDADLYRLKQMYLAHYAPKTELEEYRVLKLAAHDWRLNRCARMEAEILEAHGFEQDAEQENEFRYAGAGWGFTHDCKKAKSLLILSQVEDRAHRHFRALEKDLEQRLTKPSTSRQPGVENPVSLSPMEASHDGEGTQK
jgi:hypothetical protein